MTLLGVELRRLTARRLIGFVLVGGLAAALLVLTGVWFSARPLADAQLEQAEAAYEREMAAWEENGEEMVADCREQQAIEQERLGEAVDFGCDHMEPQREWFVPTTSELSAAFVPTLAGSALLPVFLVLVVGVTATAAEMSTGTMSTWLTFVPRRLRVLGSKLAATGVAGLPLTAVLMGVLAGGVYGVHAWHDALGEMTGEIWADVGWLVARTVLLGAVVGVVGAALGVLLRSTAAALGVVLGWVLVLEQILGGTVPRLQPLLVLPNLRAWIEGGGTYWVYECTVTDQGTTCDGVEHVISQLQAGVYLGAGAVVVVALTALVFRRRDVG